MGPETIAGDRPPRYGIQNGLVSRRARACPSPCTDRGGNPLGCVEGIRGPRAMGPETIAGDRPPRYGIRNGRSYRRARACPSPCTDLGETRSDAWKESEAPALWSLKRSRGTGPRATVSGTVSFPVGRGPVPRRAVIAEETRSDARMETSEGPRATVSRTVFLTGRQQSRLGGLSYRSQINTHPNQSPPH